MYDKLKKLMDERGITNMELCKQTGILKSSIYAWKHGEYEIGKENMEKLCEYFGVSRSYFYED